MLFFDLHLNLRSSATSTNVLVLVFNIFKYNIKLTLEIQHLLYRTRHHLKIHSVTTRRLKTIRIRTNRFPLVLVNRWNDSRWHGRLDFNRNIRATIERTFTWTYSFYLNDRFFLRNPFFMPEQSFVQGAPVQFQGLPVNWSVTDFARLITIKIGAASIKMQLHGNPVVPCANSHNHDSSSPEFFSYCSHSSWPTAITRNAVRLNQQRDDQARWKEHYLLITGVFNLVFSIRPYIDRILARFSFLRAKWILY